MKKKLLFINGHLNTGGVEKSLLDILTHLDYDRYDVDLLLTEHLGDYAPQLPSQVNVLLRSIEGTYGPVPKVLAQSVRRRDWFSFKMRLIFVIMKLFGQKRIVLAERLLTGGKVYDYAIGFRPGLCTQIAAFAVRADRRITWWHHGEMNAEPEIYPEAAAACDAVVAVSDSCRDMLAGAFPALAEKLTVIPNMLDADAVRRQGEASYPYADRSMTHIVSVGRLAPEKHFENAIYAARQLKDRGIAFRWHLVGDGALREELEEKANAFDVTDCFVFEGNRVNPYPYMKHADLFVHPSHVESFGIVAAEALALGIPCVVTRSSGVLDFLRDGENALLAAQSASDLSEKVTQALCDDVLRARLRENARCPEQFHPAAVMEKINELLI